MNTKAPKRLDRKARAMVIGLILLALSFYVGFILMTAFGR